MRLPPNLLATLIAAALVFGFARPASAQSIHLKSTATVQAGVVHVGDLATIDGIDPDLADKLSQTPVTTITKPTAIRAEQVLFAIITENGNTPVTTRLQVNGPVECAVTIAGDQAWRTDAGASDSVSANRPIAATVVTAPSTTTRVDTAPAAQPKPVERANPTLSDAITTQVIEQLGVTAQDVRISFDTVNPLLDEPMQGDAHWVCRPIGNTFIGTMQWDAQLIQTAHAARHLTVQAAILERTNVVIAQDNIRAGEVIAASQVKAQEHWIDRRIPTLFAKPDEVIGQMVLPVHGIAVGTMLDQRDFKPVQMAATGEMVTVYLISGGLTVKDQARATSSGRLHEQILLRSDGGDGAKSATEYSATLIGRDVAVVGGPLDPAMEIKLKEQR